MVDLQSHKLPVANCPRVRYHLHTHIYCDYFTPFIITFNIYIYIYWKNNLQLSLWAKSMPCLNQKDKPNWFLLSFPVFSVFRIL